MSSFVSVLANFRALDIFNSGPLSALNGAVTGPPLKETTVNDDR